MQCSHGSDQDVRQVPPHILTQQSEGRHPLVDLTAGQRHQLQFGQSVQRFLQFPPVEKVKEGGEVKQEEQGGRRVPCSLALTSVPEKCG